jgi:hypothetical protein
VSAPNADLVPAPAPEICAVFDTYPAKLKTRLFAVRRLIFQVAAETEDVGRIQECLKWGQPSYLTPENKSGSTIRIDRFKGDGSKFALYVHCQTRLISMFKDYYGDRLTYEGKRAVVFDVEAPLPEQSLRHCIFMALTYHLNT